MVEQELGLSEFGPQKIHWRMRYVGAFASVTMLAIAAAIGLFLVDVGDTGALAAPDPLTVQWLLAVLSIALAGAIGTSALWRERNRIDALRLRAQALERKALEQHLGLISRYANDIILLLDTQGRIVDANERAAERYGYERSAMSGMAAATLRVPSERPDVEARLAQARDHGSLIYEADHITSAGAVFPVEISARKVDVDGIDYLQAIIRDITERRRAEQALKASEERFRALLEQSLTGMYVIQDGRLVYVNPRMREIFGFELEEHFDPEPLAHVVPERRALTAKRIEARLSSEAPSAYSIECLRKDGTRFRLGVHARRATYEGRPAIIGVAQDVTEKVRIEEERQAHYERCHRQLDAIGRVSASDALIGGDVERLAKEITEAACRVSGTRRSNVWLFNEAETELRCIDQFDAETGVHGSGLILAEAEFANEFAAMKSARFVDANDPLTDPRTAGYVESYLKPAGITSMLDAVIQFSGRNLGLLCLEHVGKPHRWETDEITFATQLADKLAIATVNRERLEAGAKLRTSLEDSITAIAATVEMRDPYTAGHERRVAELSTAIARHMGLAAEVIEGIHFGAMIHDFGKIQVPAEILSKPTRLTQIEYELIKVHAQSGYDIIKGIDFPWPVAQMVLQHHERADGSGYPQQLKGDQIILEARILGVADTVEAMASHRPYRPGLGIDKALAEIERGRGTLYDPAVADACLSLFREGYKLPI